MIICAAIDITFVNSKDEVVNLIVCGHRHCYCFKTIRHLDNKHTQWTVQGFINHKGEFLNRKQAFEHVKEIGQYNETQRYYWEDHNQYELYSEDLY